MDDFSFSFSHLDNLFQLVKFDTHDADFSLSAIYLSQDTIYSKNE